MRRNLLAVLTGLVLSAGVPITVMASESATVTFTENKELVYSNVAEEDGEMNLGMAFEGIAPGETRTQTITLVNNNDKTVDFYMNVEVLQALEDCREEAAGAGYDIVLTASDVELYHSELGGYATETSDGSKIGLKGMNDSRLKDDVLVATLKKGESAVIALRISFDGEGMDNTEGVVDYSNTRGKISFGFKAGYQDATGITVVNKTVTEKGATQYVTELVEEKLPMAVRTGDKTVIFGGILVLSAGIVLFLLSGRKKVEEQP